MAALATSAPASAAVSLPSPAVIQAIVSTPYFGSCPVPQDPAPPICTDSPNYYLVQQGDPEITVTVKLWALDTNGQPTVPAGFNKDTKLTLSPSGFSPATVTMSRNTSSQDFSGLSFSPATNGVVVTASLGAKVKSGITSDPSDPFDVVQNLQAQNQDNGPIQYGTGPSNCLKADRTTPICAYVLLPNGTDSGLVLTNSGCGSIGNCTGDVAQLLTNTGTRYGPDNPFTMIIKCYRTICGKGGVTSYTAYMSHDVTGPLAASPPCPAKGVLGAGQPFCTDYVQSTRVGVDNLWLYVLFDSDARGSIA